MQLSETGFEGLFILKPKIHGDERGYFMEAYNKNILKKAGVDISFVQDNQSRSKYGVLRGLHYQNPPYAQSKLVRVLYGKILDVVVDIRPSSSTYLQSYSVELSEENKKQIFIPKGFAHGFVVLSDVADILYKCDEFYVPSSEGGIYYNDSTLDINWQIPAEDIILSEKDRANPLIEKAHNKFR
jgi:dTDP-4-dehydrorhamnose 3,5-epimerase